MTTDKHNKRPNVPPLRFPEFTEPWETAKLGDMTVNFSKRNKDEIEYPMYSVTNNRGFIPQSEQFEDREMVSSDIKSYKIITKGDFAYNPARINVGSIAKYNGDNDCMISSLYVAFRAKEQINAEWLMQLLKTPKMNFYYNLNAEGGVRMYLFYPNFERIRTSYPSLNEQRKVAQFLDLLDHRIAVQSGLIEDLQKLKAAIIERLYNQNNTESRIGDMVTQVSIRNRGDNDYSVLSVNNRLGFIEQSEQFEDRLVASEDTSNYKVVSRDDFAYNPARINVGSIARLTSFEKGIVSPMYICFHTKKLLLPQYLEHFFATRYFDYEMQKRLEGSVRLCLSWEGLCNIPIAVPSIEQQECIGNRISRLADKIFLEERYLGLLKIQKQYLLQAMFI